MFHRQAFRFIVIDKLRGLVDIKADDFKIFPEKLRGCPWVKCPPWARFNPIIVSPTFSTEK